MKTTKDIKDKLGMTIPEGTEITILKEVTHPTTHKQELIVSVDNGTGIRELEPKTIILKEAL